MVKLYLAIKKKQMPGIFKAYPLLDDRNRILWSAKYPNAESVKEIERSLPKPQQFDLYTVFCREYLLDMSSVRGDEEMEAKHKIPIKAGGKTAKSFEISVPMWGWGTIIHIPEKNMLSISIEDEDGYPVPKYKKIEAEYEKLDREKYPEKYMHKPVSKRKDLHGFTDHADRPSRYMV